MTNKQKIEALEKGIKSSVTPENLKEKMRTQLAQLKALEKESTSDKKPKFKVGDVVVLKGETTLEKEITSYKQNSKGEFVYKANYVSKPESTGEWNEEEIEIFVSEKKSKPKKIKPSSATPIKKASKNYYRNKEIKSVTVLENGKKVTYAGKDVLNGANFFKEGGALVSKATYVPIRNIVEVTFEDGSKDKPRNGYHIKNGATPIMENGGEVWQPIVQLVPLELEPLSSQLKAYTGDALSVGNYTNEEGKEYSTAPGEIIVHKESGRKFEMPEKIYDYVDGFNLVFDKRNNKIVTWEEGKIVAEIKDGNLDFTNKNKSISINKTKVESEFEKGFIPEKSNEKWAYIAVENKLQKLYAIAEDLEDDKTSAAWKTNQEKIKKFEDYLHRLERKYAHGGSVELPEGSLQHFENYYLEKGGKVDKEYSLIGAKVTSDIRKQSGYVTGYNENYVDIYYPSLEFGESVLYKGKDQQNVMIVKDKPSLILNSVLKEDEFDNYFIEEIVEESTPIDYEGKDNSILIVLLKPKVSHKKDVYFDPNTLILTQKGFVYKISNTKSNKWDEIVNDAEKDKLTYERYGYVKVGNFLKEEYKLGGALLSAWKRERKYVNKSEDYEVRYAKGKNRSGYKKYEYGGEVGDYAKVPVGYNMTHYGLIKKVITNDVLYPENGYEIAGIGDILHPEQFEVISSAEFNKLKKQGTEVKPNHFLIIEEEFEKGGKLDNRIKLVVVNEHTLGYIDPRTPNTFNILHASVLKGSSYQNLSAPSIPKNGKIRLATPKDFDDFRVDFTGYDNEEEYIYDSGKKSKFEKGGVLSKGDEVYIFELRKNAKVISIKELNDFEDEIVVELADGTKKDLRSSEVMKAVKPKVNPPYDPSSGLTLEEWKAKHNIQNYGKGGATEKGQGKGAIFAIAKEIRKPGEKWQDAVARAGKLNK
jgi:hypothetical protein